MTLMRAYGLRPSRAPGYRYWADGYSTRTDRIGLPGTPPQHRAPGSGAHAVVPSGTVLMDVGVVQEGPQVYFPLRTFGGSGRLEGTRGAR
jgi:hypothetical protein